jgi:hypothetical protein
MKIWRELHRYEFRSRKKGAERISTARQQVLEALVRISPLANTLSSVESLKAADSAILIEYLDASWKNGNKALKLKF